VIVQKDPAPVEDTVDYVKDSFHEELENVRSIPHKYHMKIFSVVSMPKWAEMTFSNQQLKIVAYTKLVMIMDLH
jgi:hypothetical protein